MTDSMPPGGGMPPQPMAHTHGPAGRRRPIGLSILYFIITLGIYGFVWVYGVHEDLRRYSGKGMGGTTAVLLWLFFLSIVIAFTLPGEVAQAYALDSETPPVSTKTGWWVFLPLAGGIIWFVKIQGALNRLWEAHGVTA